MSSLSLRTSLVPRSRFSFSAVSADIGGVNIQQAVITDVDGQAIAAAVAADATVTISENPSFLSLSLDFLADPLHLIFDPGFPDQYYNSANTATGGLVSDFTSYGLTADALYVSMKLDASRFPSLLFG